MKLLSPLLLLSLSSYSQHDSTVHKPTPFQPHSLHNTWAIKGKILPWVRGNDGGINGTLGIEYGFLKRNSIGVDWFFHRWAEHHENDSGYSDDAYFRDRALVTTYRFYYGSISKKRSVCFYNGISYRYGRLKSEWSDALAVFHNTLRIKKYNAIGFLFGIFFGFKDYDKFGLDVNTGVFYNMKKIQDTYTPPSGTVYGSSTANTWDFRVGLNLMWWFSK